jgi:SAM-dependent methyltransferase
MHEQSKASRRRYYDGAFHSRYFVGRGIDIGAGKDSLAKYHQFFRGIRGIKQWDLEDGDAQFMEGVEDNTFDFLHSSHCLEHMVDVRGALGNWLRIVKAGGYLVLTVPDEDLYESGEWPSRFNGDHKHTFTICKAKSWSPVSINITDLVTELSTKINIERIQLQKEFWYPELYGKDQTQLPNTESCIELIIQKK